MDAEGADGGDPPLLVDALAQLDGPLSALHTAAASRAADLSFPLAERQQEAPATLADAQAAASQTVTRDAHGRSRAAETRAGVGAPKGGCYLTGAFPDARQLPFLAWTEDFFRHVRRDDLDALFRGPGWPGGDLTDDAAFRVPALGEHYTTTWAVQDAELAAAVQAAQEQHAAARRRSMALASAARSAAARARTAAGGARGDSRRKRDGDDIITSVSPFPQGTDMAELCHVCMDGESTDDNQIVYCDACNVAVHQACYGVDTVPDGAWFCSPCAAAQARGNGGASAGSTCLLCLRPGGALKPTSGGGGGPDKTAPDGWVHVFCANWTPETYVEDTDHMEPITGLTSIPAERWKMTCTVCRQREGGCIQCAYSTCAAAFHPLCALTAGNSMQIRQRGERLEYRGFCAKHSSGATATATATAATPSGAAAPAAKPGKAAVTKRGGGAAAPVAGGVDGTDEDEEPGGDDGPGAVNGEETQPDGEALDEADVQQHAPGSMPPPAGRRSRRRGAVRGAGDVGDEGDEDMTPRKGPSGDTHADGHAVGVLPGRFAVKSRGGGSPDKLDGELAQGGMNQAPVLDNAGDDVEMGDAAGGGADGGDGVEAMQVDDGAPDGGDDKTAMQQPIGGRSVEPDDELMHIQEADLREITAAAMTASGATAADVTGDGDGAIVTAWLSQRPGNGGAKGAASANAAAVAAAAASAAAAGAAPAGGQQRSRNAMSAARQWLRRWSSEFGDGAPPAGSGVEGAVMRAAVAAARAATAVDLPPLPELGEKSHPHTRLLLHQPVDWSPATLPGALPADMLVAPASAAPLAGGGANDRGGRDRDRDRSRSRGTTRSGKGSGARPPPGTSGGGAARCAVCLVQKKGRCGTETAPSRCLRRCHKPGSQPVQLFAPDGTPLGSAYDDGTVGEDAAGAGGDEAAPMAVTMAAPHAVDKHADGDDDDAALAHTRRATSAAAPAALDAAQEGGVNAVGEDDGPFANPDEFLEAMDARREMLQAAPAIGDEVTAELLLTQGFLLRAMYANRARLSALAAGPLPEALAAEAAERARRAAAATDVAAWREVRATKARAAKSRWGLLDGTDGMQPGGDEFADAAAEWAAHELVDDLVEAAQKEEDALCVVCGHGDSEAPNEIVFCERCEIAVHQQCYGVAQLPEDEWLCWPCREVEALEVETGKSPSRPPRWERRPGDGDALDARVPCSLCPVMRGAFKRSANPGDNRWTHVACALWHPECGVQPGDECRSITGLDAIPPHRAAMRCGACGRRRGACVTCGHPQCNSSFHPLCARRAGLHLSAPPAALLSAVAAGTIAPNRNNMARRVYCTKHSPAARDRDRDRAAAFAAHAAQAAAAAAAAGGEELKLSVKVQGKKVSVSMTELARLRAMRHTLEKLRTLCERVHKREKVKRLLSATTCELAALQVSHPAEAVQQQAAAAAAAAAAAKMKASRLLPDWADGPVRVKRRRGERSSTGALGDDGAGAHGDDRKRRDGPKMGSRTPIGAGGAGAGGDDEDGGPGSAAAAAVKVEREVLMSDGEARVTNSKLPPGYLFVPLDVVINKGAPAAGGQPNGPPGGGSVSAQ